jgi:protoheme IX farnesyltransferase
VTRNHILVYTILLAPLAIVTGLTSIGGPIYMTVAVVLNVLFLLGAVKIWRRSEEQAKVDTYRIEKSFFGFSLMYLFLHFGAILAEAALKPYGLGGW